MVYKVFIEEERRLKIDESQLKLELFELFTDFELLSFDDINKKVDQPRVAFQLIIRATYSQCLISFV